MVLAFTAFAASNCEREPLEKRLCDRLDACNYFTAGVDVPDCTDALELCSADLLDSVRADWEVDSEDALDRVNCVNYLESYLSIGVCSIQVDGTIPGGKTGGIDEEGGVPENPADPTPPDEGPAPDPDPTSDSGPAPTCQEGMSRCLNASQVWHCVDGEARPEDCSIVCGTTTPCWAGASCVDTMPGVGECVCEPCEADT